MYITKVSMLSFLTENPLKTAWLQNLDRFLVQSKFYLCQKSSYIRLYRKFVLMRNSSQYTFKKRNYREILFSFVRITIFNDKERSIWPLNIAIENNYCTYNPFIKVYYFSSPVMMLSFQSVLHKNNIALTRLIRQINDN